MDSPEQLKDALLADVAAAADLDSLERLRVSALGRKGHITDLMKGLGALDPDQRRATVMRKCRLEKGYGMSCRCSPTTRDGCRSISFADILIRPESIQMHLGFHLN